METIFTKIINGEIPCTKVYEDDKVLAFLDIHPINKGHTLVIPKEQHENIYDIPDELLGHMICIVRNIAKKIKTELGADGVNVGMNNGKASGQEVFHAHMHVIPRYEHDGYINWHGKSYDSEEEKELIAQKLK
jgi:histidine triad (HIT) family protein